MEIGYSVEIALKPHLKNLIQVRQKLVGDDNPRVLFILNREEAKELGRMLIQMADAPRVD